MRQAVVAELPGLELQETGDALELIRLHEARPFDLTLVRHPLPGGGDLPVLLKMRWPERTLLLYARLENEDALAEALQSAGNAYFLDSGVGLPGLRAALQLALGRTHAGAPAAGHVGKERRAYGEAEAALEQLRQSHRQLEALSRRLVEVQEAERRALARELHDEVGQMLAGLKLHWEDQRSLTPEKAQALLGDVLRRVRDLSMDLRPPMLDEMGLVPTLLWHFERYHTQTGVQVEFTNHRPADRFAPDVETAAFRIVQEALANVARHAHVQDASVILTVHPDRLELRVEDRGVGFRPDLTRAEASGGLTGMRERARLLGGRLRVESAPGEGTRVTADLPRSPIEHRRV